MSTRSRPSRDRRQRRRAIGGLLGIAFAAAASAVGAEPQLGLELVTSVDTPVYLTHAGDDRLFIVEQPGRIRVFDPDQGLLAQEFLDIDALVAFGGEQGLFSVAFHPDYPSTPFFYVFYTDNGGDDVVARYQVSGNPNLADPNSGKILLVVDDPFANHNGGQLQFGPDGFLYAGMGDGGSAGDPGCRAQRNDTLLGKMLRLDVDQNVNQVPYYGIPTGNPFAAPNDPGALIPDEIWAFGLRNPWRFSFDRGTGDLYIADVGQGAQEEVNVQLAASPGGENYGWKVMEGTGCFDPDPIDTDCPAGTPSCGSSAYTAPVHTYPHAAGDCSVSGGFVYRGSAIPGFVGRYLFGDFCTGRIATLEETQPGVWTAENQLNAGFGLTSFGEDLDGEHYATVGNDVYRLVDENPPEVPLLPAGGLALLALGLGTLGALRLRRHA